MRVSSISENDIEIGFESFSKENGQEGLWSGQKRGGEYGVKGGGKERGKYKISAQVCETRSDENRICYICTYTAETSQA